MVSDKYDGNSFYTKYCSLVHREIVNSYPHSIRYIDKSKCVLNGLFHTRKHVQSVLPLSYDINFPTY